MGYVCLKCGIQIDYNLQYTATLCFKQKNLFTIKIQDFKNPIPSLVNLQLVKEYFILFRT